MDNASDKWTDDLRPVFQASFADQMPTKGQGSREGNKVSSVTFLCNSKLKFMTGHGGDETRSGFTSRVVVVT